MQRLHDNRFRTGGIVKDLIMQNANTGTRRWAALALSAQRSSSSSSTRPPWAWRFPPSRLTWGCAPEGLSCEEAKIEGKAF